MNYAGKVLILFMVFLYFPFWAIAKETDLEPLTLYLSDDPSVLGSGGLNRYRQKIYHPATLSESKKYLSFLYGNEDVLHLRTGDWQGTSVGSKTNEVSGSIPFELPVLKKSAISFLSKDFASKADVVDNEGGVSFISSQDYKGTVVSFSSNPVPFIKAGIGWEEYVNLSGTSAKTSPNNTFYEVAFTPSDNLSLNYRHFQRQMHIEILLDKSPYRGSFLFQPVEDVKETAFSFTVPQILQLNLAVENNSSQNINSFIRTNLSESLSLSYHLQRNEFDFFNKILMDGSSKGHIHGTIDYSGNGIEMNFYPSTTRYILGVSQSSFEIDGAGKVIDDSLLNFWQSLLAGERFFNYNLKTHSTQYYLGVENKTTENLVLRGGLQYILTRPDGYLDHWTPFPLLKIGKLDEEILNVGYTKATLGALTLGFGYRVNNIEFSYGLGQIIPIKIEQRDEAPGIPPTGDGERKGWDKDTKNSGGNIQTLQVIFRF
ncbi:MAG: hypothetical protein QME51_04380 [Planctomycetota bacterium]|nr:hypothetical protein [Planctomycetota bacterium]MDI6787587.1 hypothetical protein [Planctomycetota bacterium]